MLRKTAVILCGGKGSRLGSLGKKIPKTLVKIHSKPIIWYVLNELAKNSFNHFILPLGYKGHLISKYIKSNKHFNKFDIELIYTGENKKISQRIEQIKKNIKSKHFIILNGDAIFEINLKKIYSKHCKKNFDITFLGCSAPLSYGVVGKKNNKIVSFEREIEFDSINSISRKNFSGHVFSGISIIKTERLLKNFSYKTDFEREFYPKIIKKFKSNFFKIKTFWASVDNQKDIDILNKKSQDKFKKVRNIKKNLSNLKKNFKFFKK